MAKCYYCPYCGQIQMKIDTWCIGCGEEMSPVESKHDSVYYDKKSLTIYNNYSHSHDILIEEEVSRNPLYDPIKAKNAEEKEKERLERVFNKINSSTTFNTPKCPTCQSTNIKKISTTNRLISVATLGLASSKIGKQFECKNCGYKW